MTVTPQRKMNSPLSGRKSMTNIWFGAKCHGPVTLVIEAFGARGVAHAHGDIVFSGRHHEALIDPRRAIARDPGRRQVRSDRSCGRRDRVRHRGTGDPRAILHPAHVRRQLGDFLRGQPAAFALAVRAMHEGQHHDAGTLGDLPIDRPVGQRTPRRRTARQ